MNRGEVVGLINLAIEDGNTPVVHPNGFIQLKLSDGRRMHFWDPSIPRQKVATPIHDHIFDMHSLIVAGSILHREVRPIQEDDGFFDIYEAVSVRDAETVLTATGTRARVDCCPWLEFGPGDEYDFPAGKFHETSDRLAPAISIITKGKEFKDMNPCVLVPHGVVPDNEFTRDSYTLIKLLDTISLITNKLLPKNIVVNTH